MIYLCYLLILYLSPISGAGNNDPSVAAFDHCIVCPSIYSFWLPIVYLQASLRIPYNSALYKTTMTRKKSKPLSWNNITVKIRNSALPHNSHPLIRPTLLQWESGPIWEVAFLWETNSVQHYYLSPYEIFSDELWGLWWGCHHQRVTTYNKQNNDSQCAIQERKNKQNG